MKKTEHTRKSGSEIDGIARYDVCTVQAGSPVQPMPTGAACHARKRGAPGATAHDAEVAVLGHGLGGHRLRLKAMEMRSALPL